MIVIDREKRAFEESTVLSLGARGSLDGKAFTLVGRTCIRGRGGTLSNEWVMRFDDVTDANGVTSRPSSSCFLAEAPGGALTIFDEGTLLPSFDTLLVGASLESEFVVVERGRAARVYRWGEVEDDVDSNEAFAYVELSSRTHPKKIATIDYGNVPPRIFVGWRKTMADLELTPRSEPPRFREVPDVSRPQGVDPYLEIGDEGVLLETRWRVVGMVSRKTSESRWDEYLLHNAHVGLRWLVVSEEGHWSLVEPVDAGLVVMLDGGGDATKATFDGVTFDRISDRTIANVTWATGELPWEIAIGEPSTLEDFVHPPWILTQERGDEEVSWSRATWISPDDVARGFKKRLLPKPVGAAPNGPNAEFS